MYKSGCQRTRRHACVFTFMRVCVGIPVCACPLFLCWDVFEVCQRANPLVYVHICLCVCVCVRMCVRMYIFHVETFPPVWDEPSRCFPLALGVEGWQSLAVGQKVESAAIDHHGNDHDHDVHDDNDNDDDNDYGSVSCKLIVINTLLLLSLQRTHKGKGSKRKKKKNGWPWYPVSLTPWLTYQIYSSSNPRYGHKNTVGLYEGVTWAESRSTIQTSSGTLWNINVSLAWNSVKYQYLIGFELCEISIFIWLGTLWNINICIAMNSAKYQTHFRYFSMTTMWTNCTLLALYANADDVGTVLNSHLFDI